MTSIPGELIKIDKLGRAVAFTKGMDIVQIADELPRLSREITRLDAPKKVATKQTPVYVRHACFNELPGLELLLALGNLDLANVAGPLVNVLKKMAVNRLQMRQFEAAVRDLFDHACHNSRALCNG